MFDYDLLAHLIKHIKSERQYWELDHPNQHPVSEFESRLIDDLLDELEGKMGVMRTEPNTPFGQKRYFA
jgi:hypothetical protein